MDGLGQSWMLQEHLRAEQDFFGERFKVFDEAPEIPPHLQERDVSEITGDCWSCCVLRAAMGGGQN